MKKKLITGAAIGLFAFSMAGTANATLFNYDFSSMGYTEGQSFEGTTIDSATFTSEAGDLHYTNNYGGGIYNGPGADGDIYIEFSESVDWVSFTAGDGAGDDDAYAVSLYEFGTDLFLGTWNSPVFGGINEPEWYTMDLNVANIGSIVFDPGNSGSLPGVLGGAGGVVLIDLSYNTESAPVPEPTTMLLFGTGLAGLAGLHLRRKKK